ncbi:hypothetical protein KR044_009199 [Drosophila immigrans]|nr:hypothetical protein KR044_009199 [Drosophila immigrans]
MRDFKHPSEYLTNLETREKLIDAKYDELDKQIQLKLENLRTSFEPKPDRHLFEKVGSKYYYIEQSANVNWFQAAHKCRTLNGHLVSIKNLSEFNEIVSKLQPGKHYWIDINDLGTKGEYRSITTGHVATYFNWHGNNPDNSRNVEHCVELRFDHFKHLMNDCNCTIEKYFICQLDNK